MKRQVLLISALLSLSLLGCSNNVPDGYIDCQTVEIREKIDGNYIYKTEYTATHEDVYEFKNSNGGYLYTNKDIKSYWQIRLGKTEQDDPSTYEIYELVGYVGAVKVEYNKYLNPKDRVLIEETRISKISGSNPIYGTKDGNSKAYSSIAKHGLFDMIKDDDLVKKKLEGNQYYYLMFLDQMDTGLIKTSTVEIDRNNVVWYTEKRK